jgi:hypothetical protein
MNTKKLLKYFCFFIGVHYRLEYYMFLIWRGYNKKQSLKMALTSSHQIKEVVKHTTVRVKKAWLNSCAYKEIKLNNLKTK